MSTIKQDEILSVLKNEIENFESKTQISETGQVIQIHDGIANVYGINHAMYGELVEFETGIYGIVQNIEYKSVGVVLLGSDEGLREGSSVKRTGRKAGVPVGYGMIGRVVNALGEPIDALGYQV